MENTKTPEINPAPQWMAQFTERENKEIAFAQVYASEFAHGTTGHNALMIIAKMAALLTEAEGKGGN